MSQDEKTAYPNSEDKNKKTILRDSEGPIEANKRIAIFPGRIPPRFQQKKPPEKLVFTFPNLIIREVICLQMVLIVVTVLSLFFDAPLEGLADPNNTPNPVKAPWYFLGLQELLHYFPPFIAGILIPAMVIMALLIIPYLDINIRREGLWSRSKHKTMAIFTLIVFICASGCLIFHAYAIAIPTVLLYWLAVVPYFFPADRGWRNWLAKRSLAEWIMTWFVVLSTILTVIGTYFRGPNWSWVWPWM